MVAGLPLELCDDRAQSLGRHNHARARAHAHTHTLLPHGRRCYLRSPSPAAMSLHRAWDSVPTRRGGWWRWEWVWGCVRLGDGKRPVCIQRTCSYSVLDQLALRKDSNGRTPQQHSRLSRQVVNVQSASAREGADCKGDGNGWLQALTTDKAHLKQAAGQCSTSRMPATRTHTRTHARTLR